MPATELDMQGDSRGKGPEMALEEPKSDVTWDRLSDELEGRKVQASKWDLRTSDQK